MIAVQHYFESRDFRPGEVTQLDFERIDDDTYVVKLCEYGPNGPIGYVVAVYDGEGRRMGGARRTPHHERAEELFDGYCEGERRRARRSA